MLTREYGGDGLNVCEQGIGLRKGNKEWREQLSDDRAVCVSTGEKNDGDNDDFYLTRPLVTATFNGRRMKIFWKLSVYCTL